VDKRGAYCEPLAFSRQALVGDLFLRNGGIGNKAFGKPNARSGLFNLPQKLDGALTNKMDSRFGRISITVTVIGGYLELPLK